LSDNISRPIRILGWRYIEVRCNVCLEWQGVLDVIIAGNGTLGRHPGPCWVPRARFEQEAEVAIVNVLIAAGWLEVWEGIDGGPALTLTPYAADQLEVELIEIGMEETPVWVHRNPLNDRAPIRLQRHGRTGSLPFPDAVADPGSSSPHHVLGDEPDQPVRLWGRTVTIDKRLRAG